jgi:hypothetical protein
MALNRVACETEISHATHTRAHTHADPIKLQFLRARCACVAQPPQSLNDMEQKTSMFSRTTEGFCKFFTQSVMANCAIRHRCLPGALCIKHSAKTTWTSAGAGAIVSRGCNAAMTVNVMFNSDICRAFSQAPDFTTQLAQRRYVIFVTTKYTLSLAPI